MGALLLLIAGYLSLPLLRSGMPPFASMNAGAHPLPGKDSVSGLQVKQTASGAWTAEFDYFYTGAPADARLVVELTPAAGTQSNGLAMLDTFLRIPERGSHHLSARIQYPGVGRTVGITALMRTRTESRGTATSQHLDQTIDWPDLRTYARNQRLAARSTQDNLNQAQALIDTGEDSNIREATLMLEQLLAQNPSLDSAYVELSRAVLDTTGGPEGLHQAEEFLATALRIRPQNTDAKILLANVYAHQRRFAAAETLFKEAAASGTSNLWLWVNWGDMRQMQHRVDEAAVMYRKVIAQPITHDRNDRARLSAYEQLIALLQNRKDFDGMQALYQQRIAEFGWGSCYSADYTRFLLHVRGNIDGAVDSARRALKQSCDDAPSRQLLGLAEYAKWAGATGPSRTEALDQARIFLPMNATALYLLAASGSTAAALRQLIAAGEPIDQKDNDNLDALAHALQDRDSEAVRRLLALGARANIPVGEPGVPVALLPVIDGDVADVRLLRKLGVRYSSLRYRGVTALDLAKQQGNPALLSALGSGGTAL